MNERPANKKFFKTARTTRDGQDSSRRDTSWNSSGRWYNSIVGDDGHYYHKAIILPKTVELLKLEPGASLLDIGCGQGVFARQLPQGVSYTGVDLSPALIGSAKSYSKHTFVVGDACKPLKVAKDHFSHAVCILALQNMEHPDKVFQNVRAAMQPDGRFIIVLNHPIFRIPRQTSWGFEEASKSQYRKIQSYMTPQQIPIEMHPGKKEKTETISFHYPLSYYTQKLFEAGFVIEEIHEWCSDKVSTGAAARWENRARKEIPLFMTIVARALAK